MPILQKSLAHGQKINKTMIFSFLGQADQADPHDHKSLFSAGILQAKFENLTVDTSELAHSAHNIDLIKCHVLT